MNKPGWLKAGKTILSSDDLLKGVLLPSFSLQETNAVQFCSSWLSGQQSFNFQTSGSTGIPKKISFRRDQLLSSALLTQKALQYESGNTALICLDVNFIAGAMMLVRSMVSGLNMVIVSPSSDPLEGVFDKIDFAAFVPLQVATLLASSNKKINGIKTFIVGGAPLNPGMLQALQDFPGSAFATYGMTETISHIALQKLNGPDRQDFFEALPGVSLDTDERGCLTIQSDHLGVQPVVTQDRVTLVGKNKFHWLGRADQIINSGGIKIQPREIESIVQFFFEGHQIKNRFFVAGVPDAHLGQKVVLIVEGSLDQNLSTALQKEFQVRLSRYEIPQQIIICKQFSETATQKIDRMATLTLLKDPG